MKFLKLCKRARKSDWSKAIGILDVIFITLIFILIALKLMGLL